MKGLKTAQRYSKSLLQFGEEKKSLDTFASDMEKVLTLFNESKDLRITMASPLIKNEDKANVFTAVFPSISSELISFFKVVINNGRANCIQAIAHTFIEDNRAKQGIVSATITSAIQLDKEQVSKILEKVGLNEEKTLVTEKIDPTIIGGFILRMGDRQVDASITRRFSDMKVQLN
ncbi:MAG: F-type H+-transporting ATPase subunit delta [Luteibaculaceae bacterium]|jgi:F-type H+-transporting ATPase subunit delta